MTTKNILKVLCISLVLICMSSCDGPIKSKEPIWQIAELDKGGRAIWGTSADDIWVVGDDYYPMYHWDGDAWTAFDVPSEVSGSDLFAVWGSGPDDYWAGGAIDGGLLHWDGSTWSFVPTPTFNYAWTAVMDIWGSSADDVWAVGELAKVMHWDGTTWTAYDIGFFDHSIYSESFYGIYGTSSNNIWMAGTNLSIFFWDGSSWERHLDYFGEASFDILDQTTTLRDIHIDTMHNVGFIVGDSGINMSLEYLGTSFWVPNTSYGAGHNFQGVWGYGLTEVMTWAVGRATVDNGLYYLTPGRCDSIHNPAKPRTLYDIWGSSHDNIWAVGDDVILHYDYYYFP